MKNFRMISGIILHPVNLFIFKLRGGASQYGTLSIKAGHRAADKALERRIYMASLTHTPINL